MLLGGEWAREGQGGSGRSIGEEILLVGQLRKIKVAFIRVMALAMKRNKLGRI